MGLLIARGEGPRLCKVACGGWRDFACCPPRALWLAHVCMQAMCTRAHLLVRPSAPAPPLLTHEHLHTPAHRITPPLLPLTCTCPKPSALKP